MRFLANRCRPMADKAVPFDEQPCPAKDRMPRLIRRRRWPCSAGICRRILSLTTALILRAATPAASVVPGALAAPFGQASFVPRLSEPPLKYGMRLDTEGTARAGRLRCDGIAAAWGRPTRGHSISLSTLAVIGLLSGCTSTPLVEGGSLSSYQGLTPSDSRFKITKARLQVSQKQVMVAKTVNVVPTVFPPSVAPTLSGKQRALIANAVDRALCVSLSDRFNVVTWGTPADLAVRATVTHVKETNEITAGLSAVASIGSNFIDMGTNVPIPIPRIPIGLGSLSIEAEAIDPSGQQQAAMVWSRGATAFFSSPKVSKAGDAYDMAEKFGDDFAKLLVTGKSPFKGAGVDIPSWQKVRSTMGLAPRYAACERFGRYPGIKGFVGEQMALPPEWTDRRPKGTSRS